MNPLLMLPLWLCFPAPCRDQDVPVYPDDVLYFPAPHVVEFERAAAWGRYQYAERRWQHSRGRGLPDAGHWRRLACEAWRAWDCVDDVWRCQQGRPHHGDASPLGWLEDVRRKQGRALYYAGCLPPPVWVGEMPPPEVLPLPLRD